MLHWSAGYLTELAYTLGFYRELALSFLDYVCMANGVSGLPRNRAIRYCELGCGRGYAAALLAAANPDMTIVGVDFNPTHIAEARGFAAGAGLENVTFHEMSFGEAANTTNPEFTEFDVITMHGVYSWVLPAVRSQVHDFVRARLVPGGVFYVSYNVMPGWSTVLPIQRLLQEVASRSSGDSLSRFDKGYAVLRELIENSSAFVTQNPSVKNRITQMEKQEKTYLAHEFLNEGWQPLYVTEVMENLSDAKLAYIGSANLTENRLELAIPKVYQDVIKGAADAAMRELLKDYVTNKEFRRDVYIKGAQRLTKREQVERLSKLVFARVQAGEKIPEKYRVGAGEATPTPAILQAVLEKLDESPATGAELLSAGERAGAKGDDVFTLLEILVQHGLIHPARTDYATIDATPAQRLNTQILAAANVTDAHRCLAAPVLGSAIGADRLDRLLAPLVLNRPNESDSELAKLALQEFAVAGLKINRDENADLPADDTEALTKVVSEFRSKRLPRWRSLNLLPA